MGINLKQLLSDLHAGEPVSHRKVRLHPLRLETSAGLEYLTLGENGVNGMVSLEETTTAGTVGRLRVCNRSDQRVFILDGTTLTGSKQNRVVNLSVLLAPQSVTDIPVSCVERGRWWYTTQSFSPSMPCDAGLRGKMCAGATASLKQSKQVHVDQAAVWSHVDRMLGAAGAYSATQAYHAAFAQWDETLSDYHANLPLPDGASGVAVEVEGAFEVLDLFDKSDTLRKLWPRLVRSYSVAAINPFAARGQTASLKAFLEEAMEARPEAFESIGIGTTARIETPTAVGAALLYSDAIVHLSLFANGAARTQHQQSAWNRDSRRRPWWRLWR
jgi:hypothetical protein